METFFKNLWRFNAIAIAIVAIFGFGGMAFALVALIWSSISNTESPGVVVEDETSSTTVSKLKLRGGQLIEGTRIARFVLQDIEHSRTTESYESWDLSGGSGGYYSAEGRNHFFVNIDTGKGHWLLSTNDYLITHFTDYTIDNADPEKKRPLRMNGYYIAKTDSNGNNRLDHEDKKTYAVSDIDGTDFQELIEGIDRFHRADFIDDDTLLLSYEKSGQLKIAHVDVDERILVSQNEVPISLPQ